MGNNYVLILALLFLIIIMASFAKKEVPNDNVEGEEITRTLNKYQSFRMAGTGVMTKGSVIDIDGDGNEDEAMCFDIPLYNMSTGEEIGKATDCLSNVYEASDGSVTLVGTTFFYTSDGTLMTRGNVTVQPVRVTTITDVGSMTHITGSSSIGNGIIGGTGTYTTAEGPVRLSGMVDMSSFNGNEGDSITFDCIFEVRTYGTVASDVD